MDITATKVALACAASTLLTGLDLVRTEHGLATGSDDRASVHEAANQAWIETGAMTLGAGALAALGHVPAETKVLGSVATAIHSSWAPAAVTLAFAAGTALSVGEMQHASTQAPKGSYSSWLSHDGAVGSSFETAGLVALGAGMLPQVQGSAKRALIGAGVGFLAVGWPTSLGHGPIAGRAPGSDVIMAPGPLPGTGTTSAPSTERPA